MRVVGVDAVVAGGTGLVGGSLLSRLAQDLDYAGVTAIGRREITIPGITSVVIELEKLEPKHVPETARVAFCCLGTTIKKAGSQDAFRSVDHDMVVRFAEACLLRGVRSFHVVSAIGADADSRVFYNRVKGEMEREVRKMGFSSVCVYRPSFLRGAREESRPGERAGLVAARVLHPVLPRKLRAIPAETVARAMVNHAKTPCRGFKVHDSGELWGLAGTS